MRSEKSAEAVVVSKRRAEREGTEYALSMSEVMHQMSETTERGVVRQGETLPESIRDETTLPRQQFKAAGQGLLMQVLAKENMQRAWQRVKANKGSAGVDGLSIIQTAKLLKTKWPELREQLQTGLYRPHPVRRVSIPKPDGSERELGIPTVTDRLIQQALLQVLQQRIDPTFSEHSYGFRPKRCAQDAVLAAQRYAQAGYQVVVDVDLSKFFDRVNHDILMDRLGKRIADKEILQLIRSYLNAGVMDGGVVLARQDGTPQGGPLSPLLANVLLDEVDKALEQRGYRFARYADDCNVYVRSQRAGERVMAWLRQLYNKLHLQINEAKSAVGSVFGRKFLGYSLWLNRAGEVKRAVAGKALVKFKQRVRQQTRRTVGCSIADVVKALRSYLLGWKGYFRYSQTPSVWRKLDKWIRHRLRAIQLKHWKRGPRIYAALRKMGAAEQIARKVASCGRSWWRGSVLYLNKILTIAYFDQLGLPRLS